VVPLPAWWSQLVSNGLHELSPPELEGALSELTLERSAFLGILGAGSGWPDETMLGFRLPNPNKIDELNQTLPRPRAIVVPEDERAIALATAAFPSVLALDPMWPARGAFYAAWHDPALTERHASTLMTLTAPAVKLAPLVESGLMTFVPDWLPGGWEPFVFRFRAPDYVNAVVRRAYRLHLAAKLVYWGNRLDAAIVVGLPDLAEDVRQLTTLGPTLTGELRECVLPGGDAHDLGGGAGEIADLIEPVLNGAKWRVGVGEAVLPSVYLVLVRLLNGGGIRPGFAGDLTELKRAPRYLIPA
jgi:hypothetical protein